MAKLHWNPDEREGFSLEGNPDNKTRGLLEDLPRFLFLEGWYGAGKSEIFNLLAMTGEYFSCPKERAVLQPIELARCDDAFDFNPFAVTRGDHSTCRKITMPRKPSLGAETGSSVTALSLREWTEEINASKECLWEAACVGFCPPYKVWNLWGKVLEIVPPTRAEMVEHLEYFLAVWRLRKLALMANKVKKANKVMVIMLRPDHTNQWIEMLSQFDPTVAEKSVAVRLIVNIEEMVKRQQKRRVASPEWDPTGIVTRARILESASMPMDLPSSCSNVITMRNNNLDEQAKIIKVIREILE
jgi:hypothetical protein